MMIAADKTQSWLDQHASIGQLPGHALPWLQAKRKQALKDFEDIGLPGVRDEQWRYTNLRALKSNAYALATPQKVDALQLSTTENPRMVFVDGFFNAQLSNLGTLADGLVFDSLANVLEQQAQLLEPHFNTCLPKDGHGFSELNSAFCQDGYVLYLPANVVSEAVLEVLFVNRQTADQQAAISHVRNFVIAEANTQCSVIERHIGINSDDVYLNNCLTEIVAADNAHIDHYKIQQESAQAFHMGAVYCHQSASSQLSTHNIVLDGLVVRNDIHASLLGQGSHVEMNGLVLGKGRQHIDNHTQVNHLVPNTTSDEYYKTVLDDQSRSVFRGRIIVAQDAQLSNAEQQNNNLLLSKQAEADSKPQLEIYADDVKCSHGATVGQLEEKSLFYLKSRGIDEKSAYGLLTFAFANEVIERIKVQSVRDELTEILAGQLLDGVL